MPTVHAEAGPQPGSVVRLRQRQYLVESVSAPKHEGDDYLHRLVCLDDDAQGREVSVIWRHELGASTLMPQERGLGRVNRLDEPRHFAAYLHALKWSSVTATDSRLFQAPFRAGIQLLTHQLVPLKKALELPRVNLFIADDVGLGKTIEAGLVLQELVLRQRAEFVLVVCPASVTLQWREEMERRFGLRFEVYSRGLVARRRQERGFAVNPWATHNRFIVSYQTLRRPENYEPLKQHLEHRGNRKTMLILDEAHTAAPAAASKYAIETDTTNTVRQLAAAFEHRLFLSATPHNGHSNSFSALLEILDPQRFTSVRASSPRSWCGASSRSFGSWAQNKSFPDAGSSTFVSPIGMAPGIQRVSKADARSRVRKSGSGVRWTPSSSSLPGSCGSTPRWLAPRRQRRASSS